MAVILRGGTVVTASDYYQADLCIEGEKVAAIGNLSIGPEDQVVNVDGCLLLPGGVDAHTHFDLPVGSTVTSDDFSSGTKAAVLGGTTTIIDFATQFKGESLGTALTNWHAKADDQTYTDYGFHLAITDWNETISREMADIVDKAGVSSFKFYMAYKNSLQVDDRVLLQAFRRSTEVGALICLHCENGDVVEELVQTALAEGKTSPLYHSLTRPVTVEREATQRALALAEIAQAPVYIVHLTNGASLQAVLDAKGRGVEAYIETCPQYLLLDDSLYSEGFESAKYIISPPLRQRTHGRALWAGLAANAIDTIATDHCSFNFKGQKELGRSDFSKIPNGMPGVQTRMGLLYTYGVAAGKLSLNQFVALTSTQPAKLFGLFPRKGTIAVGSDADIVVWDPREKSVISCESLEQKVDYSPYEGFTQQGKVVHVFLRGNQVVCGGKLCINTPAGVYLPRKPFTKRKADEHVYHKP